MTQNGFFDLKNSIFLTFSNIFWRKSPKLYLSLLNLAHLRTKPGLFTLTTLPSQLLCAFQSMSPRPLPLSDHDTKGKVIRRSSGLRAEAKTEAAIM